MLFLICFVLLRVRDSANSEWLVSAKKFIDNIILRWDRVLLWKFKCELLQDIADNQEDFNFSHLFSQTHAPPWKNKLFDTVFAKIARKWKKIGRRGARCEGSPHWLQVARIKKPNETPLCMDSYFVCYGKSKDTAELLFFVFEKNKIQDQTWNFILA